MLSDARVSRIIQLRGNKFSEAFVRRFDKEWTAAVNRVKNSGKRLWCMPIVPAQKEYKNVRT